MKKNSGKRKKVSRRDGKRTIKKKKETKKKNRHKTPSKVSTLSKISDDDATFVTRQISISKFFGNDVYADLLRGTSFSIGKFRENVSLLLNYLFLNIPSETFVQFKEFLLLEPKIGSYVVTPIRFLHRLKTKFTIEKTRTDPSGLRFIEYLKPIIDKMPVKRLGYGLTFESVKIDVRSERSVFE